VRRTLELIMLSLVLGCGSESSDDEWIPAKELPLPCVQNSDECVRGIGGQKMIVYCEVSGDSQDFMWVRSFTCDPADTCDDCICSRCLTNIYFSYKEECTPDIQPCLNACSRWCHKNTKWHLYY